ncbi:Hypothetical_protein [Hexamita inflata]|uniref:Hypothetical_protein n=1 Tax=Hexamita inflata TaxID=28002 RepID=A0AA86PEP4_9EUKA|nr:Hypothetical protein HINF_LOCUS1917 [Hexamita inflata]CAI9934700.1 Hypothetical protein HINF_LOCUS22345 [Hexamita inflata]
MNISDICQIQQLVADIDIFICIYSTNLALVDRNLTVLFNFAFDVEQIYNLQFQIVSGVIYVLVNFQLYYIEHYELVYICSINQADSVPYLFCLSNQLYCCLMDEIFVLFDSKFNFVIRSDLYWGKVFSFCNNTFVLNKRGCLLQFENDLNYQFVARIGDAKQFGQYIITSDSLAFDLRNKRECGAEITKEKVIQCVLDGKGAEKDFMKEMYDKSNAYRNQILFYVQTQFNNKFDNYNVRINNTQFQLLNIKILFQNNLTELYKQINLQLEKLAALNSDIADQ